ncbi:GNAT family N-acetyltransferase [Leptospira levettii]|uniref:Hemolysin n=3 Tax=Leptospira TaxID=171 RepID=A0A2P2DDV3_9LEPT|nr:MULTISPECIES: GNAT family N-acyltransferase [Leptospira]PKA28298.1 hemolysin [Leptospira sp. mixed culture ATI2-C-A1]MBL0955945.1 GNAT family N-acetyltransferase [Leptospira sp.]MCG6147902.1 GNAT family N-acetyltransferase [Leptospira levettii]MCW7473658.1 GNAT family N-acetyltransferase [Leptospira levettii]MCW7495117.1 GNAT family N-acetyltransferase [Leptospira levettii]
MKPNTISKTERILEVRLAENQLEIERALALRYEVFNLEMGEGLPQSSATRKDRDEYDLYCHHLIVIDKSTEDKKIVGTYRILTRQNAKNGIGFYSENEFDITSIYNLPDEIAEVGRSCVHPEYRDGSVISLLWQGLAEFMNKHNVRYLMGCGSIHSTDASVASQSYGFLKAKDAIAPEEFRVYPNPDYVLPGFDANFHVEDPKSISKNIPPLLKGYLRVGAKICGIPALDSVFGTTDVFILFDRKEITERYAKHYMNA